MGSQRMVRARGRAAGRCWWWAMIAVVILGACGGPAPATRTPTATPATAPTPTTTRTAIGPTATGAAGTMTTMPTTRRQTVDWRGGSWFLFGVNYPYHRYGNDFGGNAWGAYGVGDPNTNAAVEADFARLDALGVRTVRWFVFADGRAGMRFDAAGMPIGLDEYVFRDMDAMLAIAQRHNISLTLVLLDFRFQFAPRLENGVQLGGHGAILANPDGQQALVERVFIPLFQRYAAHPAILAWEVMNEPEWTLTDAGRVDREIGTPLPLATMRAFVGLTVAAIHEHARTYATVGSANVKWARNWVGLNLDFYQAHYYDWMKPYSTDNVFAMRADQLGLDRPIVIGEFPANRSNTADLRGYLDTWYGNGFAGAWLWSFRGDEMWGSPDQEIMRRWAQEHAEAITIPAAPGR